MPRVRFELKIPVFEWAKTIHALDRVVTVIGVLVFLVLNLRHHGLFCSLPNQGQAQASVFDYAPSCFCLFKSTSYEQLHFFLAKKIRVLSDAQQQRRGSFNVFTRFQDRT
jgi:hypothetical protein